MTTSNANGSQRGTSGGSKKGKGRKNCRYGTNCSNVKCTFVHPPGRNARKPQPKATEHIPTLEEVEEALAEEEITETTQTNELISTENNGHGNDPEEGSSWASAAVGNNPSPVSEEGSSWVSVAVGNPTTSVHNEIQDVDRAANEPGQGQLMSQSAQNYFTNRISTLEQQNRDKEQQNHGLKTYLEELHDQMGKLNWDHEDELKRLQRRHEEDMRTAQHGHHNQLGERTDGLIQQLQQLQAKHNELLKRDQHLQAKHNELLKRDQSHKQQLQTWQSKHDRLSRTHKDLQAKYDALLKKDSGSESKEHPEATAQANAPPTHSTLAAKKSGGKATATNGGDVGSNTGTPVNIASGRNDSPKVHQTSPSHSAVGTGSAPGTDNRKAAPAATGNGSGRKDSPPANQTPTANAAVVGAATKRQSTASTKLSPAPTKAAQPPVSYTPDSDSKMAANLTKQHVQAAAPTKATVAELPRDSPTTQSESSGRKPKAITVDLPSTTELSGMPKQESPPEERNGNGGDVAEPSEHTESLKEQTLDACSTSGGVEPTAKSDALSDAVSLGIDAPSDEALTEHSLPDAPIAEVQDSDNDKRIIDDLFPTQIVKDVRPNPSFVTFREVDKLIERSRASNATLEDFIANNFAGMNLDRAKSLIKDANSDRQRRIGRAKTELKQETTIYEDSPHDKDDLDRFERSKKRLDAMVDLGKAQEIPGDKLAWLLQVEQVQFVTQQLNSIPDESTSPIFDLIRGDQSEAARGRKQLELEFEIPAALADLRGEEKALKDRENQLTKAIEEQETIASGHGVAIEALKREESELRNDVREINDYLSSCGWSSDKLNDSEAGKVVDRRAVRKKMDRRKKLLIEKNNSLTRRTQHEETKEETQKKRDKIESGESIKQAIEDLKEKRDEAKKNRDKNSLLTKVAIAVLPRDTIRDAEEKYKQAEADVILKEKALKDAIQARKNADAVIRTCNDDIRKEDRERLRIESELKELLKVLPKEMALLGKDLQGDISEKAVQVVNKTTLIEESRDRIRNIQSTLGDPKAGETIKVARQRLEVLRTQLRELLDVKTAEPEDKRLDINGSRDERGHSFLLVAVLCGDVKTAKTCLRLGANPTEPCSNQLTPLSVASYFNLRRLTSILSGKSDTVPSPDPDQTVCGGVAVDPNAKRMDWDSVLALANFAAETSDDEEDGGRAAQLESSEESRMPIVATSERGSRTFFDSTLKGDLDNRSLRRQCLLEKSVYEWFCKDDKNKTIFLKFLTSLLPETLRTRAVNQDFICHRRAIIGLPDEMQYEVLAMKLNEHHTVIFTPFVTSIVEGFSSVGVLIWAVCPEKSDSLFKSLIETTEFLRNKWDSDDVFPGHAPFTLELGKDMHLLDLKSTNIYTSRPALLFVIDVDEGELELLEDPSFTPRHRVLDHERRIARTLFQQSEEQEKDGKDIMSKTSAGKSILLMGGAGTGKTKLLIDKVISEPLTMSCLVVTRLSRLLSLVKSNVENARETNMVKFTTYEDLMAQLAFKVSAPVGEERCFPIVSQVHFGDTKSTGEKGGTSLSFVQRFVNGDLTEKERKRMKTLRVEALTLFTAIRTIKSNSRCLETLSPLSREAYLDLPDAFGLDQNQRNLVYDLFERYQMWLQKEVGWDEADRTLYVLKYGPSVFHESQFVSWRKRYTQGMHAEDLVDEDGRPLLPFFYHKVLVDEAQDFSELDLTLFIRMSQSRRSVFLAADAAQSVEVGLSMRASTVNEVIHASSHHTGIQVKDVIDNVQMKINHRTHEQNLAISQCIRKILARSFEVPWTKEHALITGKLPQVLSISRLEDLAHEKIFRAASIAFICPDEIAEQVRSLFLHSKIGCDVFGVREAKGLEFDSVALLQFFSFFESRKELGDAWKNSLRWLFSKKESMAITNSSEEVLGRVLEPCDYLLSHPELQDQAAMLYTALTRARNRLYIIETSGGLGDYAFRCFASSPKMKGAKEGLGLAQKVDSIDEGTKEMTAQQHKARGVLLVTQAFTMSRDNQPYLAVQAKLEEARSRFAPDKGNDDQLWKLCTKHMEVIKGMDKLKSTINNKFFRKETGEYDLKGRYLDLLPFEDDLTQFFRRCDTFVLEEAQAIVSLVRQMTRGTLYEQRFERICAAVQKHLGF